MRNENHITVTIFTGTSNENEVTITILFGQYDIHAINRWSALRILKHSLKVIKFLGYNFTVHYCSSVDIATTLCWHF
jgi:hypothetical protein